MRGKRGAAALCALGYALAALAMLLGALLAVGTDADLYFRLQMRAGILDEAGVSEDGLRALDDYLARYLSGEKVQAPEVEVFGARQAAFNAREAAHLEDCARLFALARGALWTSVILGAALLLAGALRLRGDAGRILRCLWLGLALLLLPLGSFALWAALDFSSAFTFFHELLFTNDLWLLDPATELLIRICPSSMFAGMGLRIAALALAGGLAPPLMLGAALWARGRKEKGKKI